MADDSAILSDVDDDEDLSSSHPAAAASTATDHRLRDLQSELEQERQLRRAAEESLKSRDVSLSRLKAFAQDIIKKRDEITKERDEIAARRAETLRERDDAIRERDEVIKERDEAIKERDGALRERESVKSEAETASQLMASGIDLISGKVARFRAFDGFPKSQKYATGLPAVAYGAIKRANDIVDEMTKQFDLAAGERDRAQQQIEHRNYEIAIEVSQLEATIARLKEEVSEKEKAVIERGAEISEMGKEISELRKEISVMEKEISEVRQFGEEKNAKLKDLEARIESQRPVIIDQLSNISKTFEKVNEIVVVADGGSVSDQRFFCLGRDGYG
ncbi:cilia- and flagella-associated protein 45 [Iris pallida]|uniref:Cilia- and flagella-associated protein 45 n=1 Tax=Iris pallida TaxID=29817 RepID=A0AAX6GYE6_IRIPA|nr:cilia- and flagella-associated protein 45 [Iris pallida]